MKTSALTAARKRPVNLTLSEDLVHQARSLTDNLSGVVESLLSDFVSREKREQLEKSKVVEAAVTSWNRFNSKTGSFADEHSTL